MGSSTYYQDIKGILAIYAENPKWPSPANLFVIPDEAGFSMIDVGCGSTGGQEHLLKGLDFWDLNLDHLHTVVLSHAHPDHMGAMVWLLQEVRPRVLIHRQDAPFAMDARKLAVSFDIDLAVERMASTTDSPSVNGFDLLAYFEQVACPMSSVDRVEAIEDGDILELGSFSFRIVHTPGHSPGHVALFDEGKGILLPGDLIGQNPTWYTPASGGVTRYLESLEKLESVGASIILPAHGSAMHDPSESIQTVRKKLLQRDAVLTQALANGSRSFLELNRLLFQDPLVEFFPGCAITESHLSRLQANRTVVRGSNQRFRLRNS